MKKYVPHLLAVILSGFGLLTLFLSTSVILDLFGIRAREGNYVLFVVWSNLISSILYLMAAYGLITSAKWTTKILSISVIILIAALTGLMLHANSGGLYETKTIGALIFRISLTLVFTLFSYLTITKKNTINMLSITLISLSLLLMSCGDNPEDATIQHKETAKDEDHQHVDASLGIELNQGEKWKVDDHMMEHIRNMEQDIEAFNQGTQKDYNQLALALQSNIDQLTSNCTMTGKAHDELHKWLLPYIDTVTALAEAQNEKEAIQQFKHIQTSFITFNQYFI